MADAFENRLKKLLPQRRRWAARRRLTAFRIYDGDIPEYGFALDEYAGRPHLSEFVRRGGLGFSRSTERRAEVLAAVAKLYGVPTEQVPLKQRVPKVWGEEQYEKRAAVGEKLLVEEDGTKLLVNLTDYLDTGLFLDHRETRLRVREESRGKRLLNLFCYTGAFTAHAATHGAAGSVSVDLSNTYLAWAKENLAANGVGSRGHELLRADASAWVHEAAPAYCDVAIVDPPSHSRSAAMDGAWDVQRDHVELLKGTLRHLRPTFILYFSTNFRGFQLGSAVRSLAKVEETTPGSIPEDVRDKAIHRCFRLTPLR